MSAGRAGVSRKPGFFDDPVMTWQNDDLLLGKEARQNLENGAPGIFRVLNWPELRELFLQYDDAANRAKRATDRWRVATVALSSGALLLTALAGFLPIGPKALLGSLGVALVLGAGVSIAYGTIRYGGRHSAWLLNRFRTERLRQLNAQSILGEFDLAAAAVTDSVQFDAFTALRRGILDTYVRDILENPYALNDAVDKALGDRIAERVWIDPLWQSANPNFEASSSGRLLEELYRRRIETQGKYLSLKLAGSVYNATTRLAVISHISMVISYILLFFTFIIGFELIQGGSFVDPVVIYLTAAQALGGAVLAAMRLATDAFGLVGERARYGWYEAAVESHNRDFLKTQGPQGRFEALCALEESAYREMREFLELHSQARPGLP